MPNAAIDKGSYCRFHETSAIKSGKTVVAVQKCAAGELKTWETLFGKNRKKTVTPAMTKFIPVEKCVCIKHNNFRIMQYFMQ
jgi:hypothetical protein